MKEITNPPAKSGLLEKASHRLETIESILRTLENSTMLKVAGTNQNLDDLSARFEKLKKHVSPFPRSRHRHRKEDKIGSQDAHRREV